jgi:hypothetical protein
VTRIAAYVPDLIDRSKVAAAAPGITFVARPDELASVDADLVVLDLSRPGAVDVIPRIQARTLGFGRHTQRELLDAARRAGCDNVVVRSDFFPRLPELLR